MSHFSVSVIVPHDYSSSHVTANDIENCLHRILAPYDEQTEEAEYREFEDRTDEAKADYETDTMRVIRYPDGTIRSIYDRIFTDKFYIHEDVIYQYGAEKSIADKLQTEESKALELVNDYPVKAWYASFEAYCEEHRGYIQDSEGLWGYTYNPNAKWDWWQIGGRFSRNFLVKEDLEDCIISYDRSSGEPDGAPKGYKYVDAARKKDICWDLMKQLTVEEVEKGYQKWAPYDEQTEEAEYREFEDRTDEAKADYETDTMRVIRYPDGTIRSIYDRIFTDKFYIHEDVIYQYGAEKSIADKLQTEESKALELVNDYPVKAWYASFEAYCEEHRGYIQDSEGLWGYTYNPNAKWDWWQIGGRFSRNFLVKEDLEDCIISYDRSSGEPDGAPKGYKYVDAARKKDICWDLMKQLTVEEVEKGYQKCVAAFASNDPTGFGPLTKIVEDGIASWGSMIYLKGETLDEFKARKGATDMDQYMISSFAAIDRNGDWLGSGDMGWFGISTNDKEERAWNDELQTLMNEAQDDDFLVVVDCHI